MCAYPCLYTITKPAGEGQSNVSNNTGNKEAFEFCLHNFGRDLPSSVSTKRILSSFKGDISPESPLESSLSVRKGQEMKSEHLCSEWI